MQSNGIKDAQGAYRYLNHGNLPFPREVINFNQDKLRQREKANGKKLDYEILVDDLMAVSKVSWYRIDRTFQTTYPTE